MFGYVAFGVVMAIYIGGAVHHYRRMFRAPGPKYPFMLILPFFWPLSIAEQWQRDRNKR